MIAGFGSGAAFSLVSGMSGTANPLQAAFSTGVLFAALQGGFFQVLTCSLSLLTLLCLKFRHPSALTVSQLLMYVLL